MIKFRIILLISLAALLMIVISDVPDHEPLQGERTIDGIKYKIDTELIQREYAYLQATLTVSNISDQAKSIRLPLQCPMSISSTLDRKRRESPYLSAYWQPDWYPQNQCALGLAVINVEPHESQLYVQEYLVRESLQEEKIGHHYLLAYVYLEGNGFWLDAGELDLHY